MKLFRKIDTITGNFLEDVLFESHPTLEDDELDPQYVEEAPPQGLYLPRYRNGVWVEGGVAPEPVPQALSEAERIEMLESMLLLLMME